MVVAAYAVISGISSIGLGEIRSVLSTATWSLVLVALVLVQFTNLAQAVAIMVSAIRNPR